MRWGYRCWRRCNSRGESWHWSRCNCRCQSCCRHECSCWDWSRCVCHRQHSRMCWSSRNFRQNTPCSRSICGLCCASSQCYWRGDLIYHRLRRLSWCCSRCYRLRYSINRFLRWHRCWWQHNYSLLHREEGGNHSHDYGSPQPKQNAPLRTAKDTVAAAASPLIASVLPVSSAYILASAMRALAHCAILFKPTAAPASAPSSRA